jgi:hypothetical protein
MLKLSILGKIFLILALLLAVGSIWDINGAEAAKMMLTGLICGVIFLGFLVAENG